MTNGHLLINDDIKLTVLYKKQTYYLPTADEGPGFDKVYETQLDYCILRVLNEAIDVTELMTEEMKEKIVKLINNE